MPQVYNMQTGRVSGTPHGVYVSWQWSDPDAHTDYFRVEWYYFTGGSDNQLIFGSEEQVPATRLYNALWTAPNNARLVRARVTPVSTTYDNGYGGQVSWWYGEVNEADYVFDDVLVPPVPSVPTVAISGNNLTAYVDYTQSETTAFNKATHIEFTILEDDTKVHAQSLRAQIGFADRASISYAVRAGHRYKVCARALAGVGTSWAYLGASDWSAYSANHYSMPSTPTIKSVYSNSRTSVVVTWDAIASASSYILQYAVKSSYFDASPENVQSLTITSGLMAEITLGASELGTVWYFRLQAVNQSDEKSGWSAIKSLAVGAAPGSPTTWSNASSVKAGATVKLYWSHNSEDGSAETSAEVWLKINGAESTVIVTNTDDPYNPTSHHYDIDTSKMSEGATIQWKVRTRGVIDTYGPWSVTREIRVFTQPAISVVYKCGSTSITSGKITSFPLNLDISMYAGSQNVVGYSINIKAENGYTYIDEYGKDISVVKNSTLYTSYIQTNATSYKHTISAQDVMLKNTQRYTITVVASLDSGLTAETFSTFTVNWTESTMKPSASYFADKKNYTISLTPYLQEGSNASLSVYRREYDGSFTEIATGLSSASRVTVYDPHPALDFGRYRVIATSNTTGVVAFTDLSVIPMGVKSIVIQWDDDYGDYGAGSEGKVTLNSKFKSSMVVLPYNVDVKEDRDKDVALVKYIGRRNPVSYYGTHIGESARWDVEIPRTDKDTIYQLRRLATFCGDVYVREPSGVGYWANITVSFGHKHTDLLIPVEMTIKRVEGGK